ncbi:hypothetical protein E2320_016211 [Naja naja]|nr:hypothetical protein E2320_016211 [Naja naja]
MWLYLAALLLVLVLGERDGTHSSPLVNSGFGNRLARQLDVCGLWVLAACLTPEGAEQLEKVMLTA